MSLSITEELKQTFRVATLRREAKELLTGRQWEKHRKQTERCANARRQAEQLFEDRYETRLAQELKRLQNEDGQRDLELTPDWAMQDRFNGQALLAQADINIRNAQETRLSRINQFEEREIEALLYESARENQMQGTATSKFNQKADRRSGEVRRIRQTHKQES